MRIVRFKTEAKTGCGIFEGSVIKEIEDAATGHLSGGLPCDPHHLTCTGKQYQPEEVTLLAPCRPSKIVAVGLNYRSHADEIKMPLPDEPLLFLKPSTAVIGPGDAIIYPSMSRRVDYEAELGVVIGAAAKNVSEKDAPQYILGYTCFNDVTERDLTRVQGQLTRSKGFDTFGPPGPCIATALDPTRLTVQTYLNGRKVQDGHTGNMVFSVAFLVAYLSRCMTLYPGDVISTGTPGGIGPMKIGDVVEAKIDGIGTLRNLIQAA
ncbi:MAG: DUF2437 domain-containing protein [Deltaproteobacteria bacterium]|nr:MAG: DUF2437 domain-containing protein [Deltaproteobacteria bacterium]